MDYGIDASVHLTQRRPGSDDDEVTGQHFAVQLRAFRSGRKSKAGSAPKLTVETRHLRYWRNRPEATMLVACELPNGPLHYRWIDDAFLAELTAVTPSWFDQESVTVPFDADHQLASGRLDAIREYVAAWRRTATLLLPPGAYLRQYERTRGIGARLANLARQIAVESVPEALTALDRKLQRVTYMVAVAGPSRAGKSTLLNVLVGRNLSPVETLPTTAVPLVILPGETDEAFVEFLDGRREPVAPDANAVREFATQEENLDNHKGVRRIDIFLTYPPLQPGIGFVDAPGLHDPSEEMQAITDRALASADAVLYVLDATPFRSGGFAFDDHKIADLRLLIGRSERVFLLVNKADQLVDDDQRSRLMAFVDRELARFHLRDGLAAPPLLLSAENGDGVEHLHRTLWGFLLQRSNVGVLRLATLLRDTLVAAELFQPLLQVRRERGKQAGKIDEDVAWVSDRRTALERSCRDSVSARIDTLRKHMARRRGRLVATFEAWLRAIPTQVSLPPPEAMREYVRQYCWGVFEEDWGALARWAIQTQVDIDGRIADALRDSPAGMRSQGAPIWSVPTVDIEHLVVEAMPQPLIGLLAGGAIAGFLGGIAPLVGAALGWLFGKIIGEKERRRRQIAKHVERLAAGAPRAIAAIEGQLVERVESLRAEWLKTIARRIGAYVSDLERAKQAAGKPLQPGEERMIEAVERDLATLAAELGKVAKDVNALVDGRTEAPAA